MVPYTNFDIYTRSGMPILALEDPWFRSIGLQTFFELFGGYWLKRPLGVWDLYFIETTPDRNFNRAVESVMPNLVEVI